MFTCHFASPYWRNSCCCCSGQDWDAGTESQAAGIHRRTLQRDRVLLWKWWVVRFLCPTSASLSSFSSCVCIWGACATTPDGVFQTVRFALIESNFLFFFSSLKRYRLGGKDPSLPLLWRPSYVEPTVKRDFVRGFSSDDGCYDAIGAERLGGQWSLLSHRVEGRRRGWR